MPELFLFGPAIQFLDSLDPEGRQDVAYILELIRLYPEIDNRRKFAFPVPPAVAILWSDSKFWVVYHAVNADRINVWNIGHSHEDVRPFRIVTND